MENTRIKYSAGRMPTYSPAKHKIAEFAQRIQGLGSNNDWATAIGGYY